MEITEAMINEFIAKYFTPNIGQTWLETIKKAHEEPCFQQVCRELIKYKAEERSIVPDLSLVWAWTKCCELEKAKVFLVLQDPTTSYKFINTGKSLAVEPTDEYSSEIPDTLDTLCEALNIADDHPDPQKGPLLQGWQDQGVVLLNAIPTLINGKKYTDREESEYTSLWDNWMNVMATILKLVLNDDAQKNKQVLIVLGKVAKIVGHSINVNNPDRVICKEADHPNFANRPECSDPPGVIRRIRAAFEACDKHLGEAAIDWNHIYENGGSSSQSQPLTSEPEANSN